MVLTYQAERMPEQIRLKVCILLNVLENQYVYLVWIILFISNPVYINRISALQVGGVDPKQLAVYEEFARNVPGFLPSNDLSQPTGFLAQPMKVCIKLSCFIIQT